MSAAGYLQPPIYDGHEFVEDGVRRCNVTMVIPQHPLNGWEPIVTQMLGHYPLDTWELTAMRAMTTFCYWLLTRRGTCTPLACTGTDFLAVFGSF